MMAKQRSCQGQPKTYSVRIAELLQTTCSGLSILVFSVQTSLSSPPDSCKLQFLPIQICGQTQVNE